MVAHVTVSDFLWLVPRGGPTPGGPTPEEGISDFLMRKNYGFTPNLDFNPLPTRFNLTEFLPTSMHSESMQHIKGEENK